MNLEIIRYVLDVLDIDTEILVLSELGIHGKGSRLFVDICRFFGGTVFLANRGVRNYLDEHIFLDAGIQVMYINPPSIVYPQLWGDFIANLSVFDLIFNCGEKSREIMYGR